MADNNENGSAEAEATESNVTKLESDIIKQIEYYFGESNMRRDKFLQQKVAEAEGGWVPFSVLLTFNRLKSLTEDAKVIAECLEKSTNGVVQVSEDKEKVRRHPDSPLPEFNEARRKELSGRTAYAKGFPLDANMSQLVEFFNGFDHVENVVMRKYFCQKAKTYHFKGSVFVLFEKREYAEDFVKREGLKYNEKDLLRYMQEDYAVMKKKELIEKNETRKARKKAEEEKNEPQIILPKKTVVHFEGVEGDISREEIKKRVAEIDPALTIAFIHFERGNKEGELRFSKEDEGTKFMSQLEDNKMKVREIDLVMSLLEGEAEEEFLKAALEDMKKARQRSQQKHHHHKGGKKGGRGKFDRKRKNEDCEDENEVPAKQQKNVEEIAV